MIPFVTYDARGVICITGTVPTEGMAKRQARTGMAVLVGVEASMERQFVDLSERGNPVVRDMPKITPVVDGLTVSGLPVPCTVEVADAGLPDLPGIGTVYEIEDGVVEFSSALPGKYRLKFRAVNFIPSTVDIDVKGLSEDENSS